MAKRKKRPIPKMNKRGRPAKPKDEGPTPEMVAKRIVYMQGEPVKVTCFPFQNLYIVRAITLDQLNAGQDYKYLPHRRYGEPQDPTDKPLVELDDAQERLEVDVRKFNLAEAILNELGARAVVENCAVREIMPVFTSETAMRLLKEGLTALAEWRIRAALGSKHT